MLALLITSLVAVGRSITFQINSASKSHMATPALIAGILVLEPSLAVAAVVTGVTVSTLLIRRQTSTAVFSIGIAGIQALLALGIVHAAGWNLTDPAFDELPMIGAIFLAGGIAITVAGLLVSISARLTVGGPLLPLFREIISGGNSTFYLIDVSKICFGLTAAMLMTWTPINILLIVVPVAAISQALRRSIGLRHQLEQALRETEHSLAEAQRLAHLGSWEWEYSGRNISCSEQLLAITGLEPDNPMLVTPADLLGLLKLPERNNLERIVNEVIVDRGTAQFDHEINRPDGMIRYVHHVLAWAPEDERAGNRLVGTVLDITDRKRLELELRYQAYHDGLTGLPNREFFLEQLDGQLRLDFVTAKSSAVIFLDLDHFKQINDQFGHAIGDAVLTEVARRLSSTVRPQDTVARLSGDEFTVLATGLGTDENLEEFANRLLDEIQKPVHACGNVVPISASAGLVYIDRLHESPSDVLREADAALYRAKRSGRGKLSVERGEGPIALREPA